MIRDVSYRVAVLRKGGEVSALSWAAGNDPTVYFDASGEIKSSFSGEFYVNPIVDLLSDEIQPILTVDGTEYPLGVFRAATVTTAVTKYGKTVKVEAYDRCWLLKSNKTQTRVHYAKGTSYLTVVQQILTACGVALAITTASAATIATDREDWEIGTEYLTIINALLSEINFSDIWFDFDGVAHLEKYEAPSSSNIDREYRDDEYSIITPEYTEEMDIYEAPNVFIVNVSNPDYDEPMTATGVNDSMISALSTVRRGRRILATPVELDNIESQAALQQYADNLAIKSMFATQKIKFYTAINPAHGVGDVIALYNGELVGVYEETDWKIEVRPGALMEHQAKKVVFV